VHRLREIAVELRNLHFRNGEYRLRLLPALKAAKLTHVREEEHTLHRFTRELRSRLQAGAKLAFD
jgi:hypothetical protein